MGKTIYLTESQFDALMERQMINESLGSILEKVAAGVLSVYVACAMVNGCKSLPEIEKQRMIQRIEQAAPNQDSDLLNNIGWIPQTFRAIGAAYQTKQ